MIQLTKISETNTAITLGWTPVPGAIGYRFRSASTSKWSHTFDPTRQTAKFSKAEWYEVEALGVADAGRYPQVAPPPPPPAGNLLYSHDYTGTSAPSFGWADEEIEWGFQTTPGAQASVIPNGYAPGVSSLRMTLPATPDGWLHTEGLLKRMAAPGEKRYYGIAFKLALDWKEPSSHGWGNSLMHVDYQACVNGNVGLYLHDDHARLVVLGGQQSWSQTPNYQGLGLTREYNLSDSGAQGPSPRFVLPGRMNRDVWHLLIVAVKSAYDFAGSVEIWHKIKGEADFVKTVDKQNIPTLQWGPCNNNATVIPKGQIHTLSDKFGAYSAPANFARTYEHANILLADSFEPVKSKLL